MTQLDLFLNMGKNRELNKVSNLIYFLIHNKKITREQQIKRDRLLTRDCVQLEIDQSDNEEKKSEEKNDSVMETKHMPKETASFLSLFNTSNGFKFLTHDFDPDSTMTFNKLMQQALEVFNVETKKHPIPKSLFALMKTILEGNKEWSDYSGTKHKSSYNCSKWKAWIEANNGIHPLHNESFAKEIQAFRRTIRLVKPDLQDMVKDIASTPEFHSLKIETQDLEKADFYTYVLWLNKGIKRILKDMSYYADKYPNVKISFERIFGDEYNCRIIKITQIGSSSTSLEDVLQKYRNGGGAFKEIEKCFIGYCNWSVEAEWDEKPIRWNILSDIKSEEIENIEDPTTVLGFTHILTYFSK